MFTLSIKFMKDEAIKLISLETGDQQFKEDDIQWVLTVPAIWTPAAKQFMREAAYQVGLNIKKIHCAYIVSYRFLLSFRKSLFPSHGCIDEVTH